MTDVRELIERLRRGCKNPSGKRRPSPRELEAANALTAALEREEALRAILDDVERGLQEIYSGDESPVLLRTRIAKCARRHEAGKTLRQLIRARADLSENPNGN